MRGMSAPRRYSTSDRWLLPIAAGLKLLVPTPPVRPSPATSVRDGVLAARERRHAAGLMRINHAGEVAAQGLYHGQAAAARGGAVATQLRIAAEEERDHMIWCTERLQGLGSRPSLLSPLWYAGSFAIGAAAGLAGDRWSLGFVAETERQVSAHLEDHLGRLPAGDLRSRAIITAMRDDEQRHGAEAEAAGGLPLPTPVRRLMARVAGVMKAAAYRF
ncbi:2-polyprenyl-3-methyl-6-methoxy-1,4-benzoquinone monooxygenase [Flagellatimonas centrodinii]|uniref:2-polyprenyl-3-methyl-6-methoxy-1,4-benzoquinone monooxygenase n=1 Tax=Flagellatimonas centrodinii TaxID=2806210 RepID=UPI00344E7A40